MALTFVKKEMTPSFMEEKPKVCKIAQQTIPAVNFQQLVNEVAKSCSVNPTITKAVVEDLSVVNQSSLNSLGEETEKPNAPEPGGGGGGADFS